MFKFPAILLPFCLLTLCLAAPVPAAEPALRPVQIIFDTDMGNDCDDALALAVIHALQSRGECELLAVTITKDHELAAPFVDCVNTFYGRGNIPIGVCRSKITPEPGKFNQIAQQKDGDNLRYPHDLISGKDAPSAVSVLRNVLAKAEDQSVIICQVGFSTNLADLLNSGGDELSPLDGIDLVRMKVKELQIMAGSFKPVVVGSDGKPAPYGEYNVIKDIRSAQHLSRDWPTPIIWSGYEIGLALEYPYQSALEDYRYVKHHPVAEAYLAYCPPKHNRPTWDLTCILQAVRPNHRYFDLSPAGHVQISEEGYTTFKAEAEGRDRYLMLQPAQQGRTLEALIQLSSQPPAR